MLKMHKDEWDNGCAWRLNNKCKHNAFSTASQSKSPSATENLTSSYMILNAGRCKHMLSCVNNVQEI